MKKILLSALLIAGLATNASAVTYAYDVPANYTGSASTGGAYALSTPANFKTGNTSISSNYNKSGKWYVNAGHGGFDSDDRPTPMPLIGEYFYESEGNLDRALHMEQWLIKNGGTVKMSRRVNTSAYDLNLTSIATYSSNYQGYFISMHSNGANASANYHVALYKGSNATNSIGGSERMAYWNSYNNYKNGCLTETTYGTPRSMADYDLMGWHYGVLRTNTQPGYLVETWFHDYRPESLRFKSSLYNKFLAWQIAVGNLTAPGGSGSLPACIVGDVRDTSKGCGYTNYTTRGRDSYLALNNVSVNLSGNGLNYTVTTGAKCNGVYAFFVPAGTYTLTFKKDGYKTVTKTVTATANKATQNDINMSEGVDTGISLNPTSTGFGETAVGNTSAKTITVTGTSLSANISISNSDNTNFSISKTSLGATGGTFDVVFKPSKAGSHSTTITFTSGTNKASMVVTGTAKNPPLTFTEGWNFSEKSGKKASWMSAGFTNYRNMAFGDGKLYIVDAPNGKINVVKAQSCEFIKELNMTGVEGGALKLVDVAFVDGKLIGTNIALSSNETMKTLKVYIWDNDDAAPRVLLETTDLGGMNRIGDAIEVQGNLTSGKLCYLAQQTRDFTDAEGNVVSGKNCNSIVTYAITNGVVSTTPVVADIDGFVIGLSPRAIPDGNNFWVAGQSYLPSQVTANGQLTASIPLTAFNIEAAFHGCGNDFVPFKYKGVQYAFATDYQPVTKAGDAATADEIKTTTLLGGRAILIDGSQGWAVEGLTNTGNYPSAGLGSTIRNTTYSSSICVNVNGDAGVEMWVLVHNQGLAYYKCGTAPTYTYEKVPEITVPDQVTFSTVENIAKTQTITVGAELLTGDITASLSGNPSFAINKTTLGKDGGDITITYRPTAAGTHTATLTLASAGAATKTVALKGTAEAAIALGLTKVWQNTTSVPGAAAGGDYRFAAVSNGKLLVNDKVNSKIIEVTSTGSSDYFDASSTITANYSQSL
ncbi:MAG: PEGA domain-containing protein, partial [Bacteroidales bacterium]|nr:PEGA domain-containing protein [Bacteroidales bacterium]